MQDTNRTERHQKAQKMNNGAGNATTTTIEDFDDNILTQILFRLPSCATVLSCSPVNKRWCSLISDSKFAAQFTDHKMKSTTLSHSGSDIDANDQQQWTFITTMILSGTFYPYVGRIESILRLPKFSLAFLPYFRVEATFKDLVLCRSSRTNKEGDRLYYITNPITKQWTALPPCPNNPQLYFDLETWAALICEQSDDYTRDYKFRVVMRREPCRFHNLVTYYLAVYCSEIREWKEINLTVPETVRSRVDAEQVEIVVCDGIIYLKNGLCLVALDPFDVNDTCDPVLDARVMPPLPGFGCLQASSGKLFLLYSPERQNEHRFSEHLVYMIDGRAIELSMVVCRLDLNLVPLVWKPIFQGSCAGILLRDSIKPPWYRLDRDIRDIRVHPYDDRLIFMYLRDERHYILCDTRTGCIKPLDSFLEFEACGFHRLEIQWWPTSVPKLMQCLTESDRPRLS